MRIVLVPYLLMSAAASCVSIGCGFVLNNVDAGLPSISCSATPQSLVQGDQALITASSSESIWGPLQLHFSASAGTLVASGNSATLSTTGVPPGKLTILCQGTDKAGGTTSATTAITVNSVATTTTTLTASPNPVLGGAAVTLSGIVSSTSGSPGGSVAFLDDGAVLGTALLSTEGRAQLVESSLAPGTHIMTAKYIGGSVFPASQSLPLSLVVLSNQGPPSITPLASVTATLAASPNPAVQATPITLTGTLSSPSGTPTGAVTFMDADTILGSAPVSNSGIATLAVSTLQPGTHLLTAGFAGNSTFASSVSTPLKVVVSQSAAPIVTCSAAPSSINQGGSVTIVASASSPVNRPVTLSFSSSRGVLSVQGDSATLNSVGIGPGAVSISCKATDNTGQTTTSTTSVWINATPGEQALTAYNFTDSIGVNVHLHYGNTPYVTNFPEFLSSVVALGVHHYRNGIDAYAYPFEYTNAEALAGAGLKADWLIDVHDTAQNINAIHENAPDSIEDFEGPNEDDSNVGPVITNFSALLYNTVRANPSTANVPIYAPTFKELSSIAQQESLAATVDYGNMHDYYYPRNPETPSYGGPFLNCGNYGSMAFNICAATVVAPGLPVVSTETGYISGTQSDEVIGRYIPRTLFKHLQMGVMRTYIYEFLDEVNSPGYGLVNADFTPKPAYTAVNILIALFDDSNFSSPGSLDFTISGQTTNVDHVLFQKQDGTFLLAIWLGVLSANTMSPYQTYEIPPQAVSIAASAPVGTPTVYTLDDNGVLTPQSAQLTDGAVNLSVTDRVTVVSFGPAN